MVMRTFVINYSSLGILQYLYSFILLYITNHFFQTCLINVLFFQYLLCLQFLGIIISAPFSNLKLDTNAVQNWEGFWLIFVINYVFHFSYSAISTYQVKFAIVHREVHNKVYPLSAYYMSELMIVVCNMINVH